MPFRRSSAFLAVLLASGVPAAIQAGTAAQGLAVANPQHWPAARSPSAITDAVTENVISALIARMTVEQKVGQVIQADIGSITPADIAKYPLGSILAGGNSGPYGNERADAATWKKLVDEFRTASKQSGAGIPILFGVDAVHGHSNLPGATIFPHNIGLGAAHDPELIARIGKATAAEIAGSGIEWTFAPTLAVPQDLRWGRSYEGYAADPALVAAYGRAMTIGLQGRLEPGKVLGSSQVAATAKHFLADGGTFEGRDQGDARISEQEMVARHALGYPAVIDAGALTVMASFSSWNGVKHHGNASLLTGVLKDRMGFAGLVVGDWNGHGQVAGCTATHCPVALNAGIDLYMAPDSWRGLFDATVEDVKAGRIASSRLDDAVRRILRVKFKLGLMGPAQVERGNPGLLGAPDHLALAREAVAKSLVLLKNESSVLPLRPGVRALIAGPGADSMAMQAGGWTISWQGADTTAADFPKGQTIGTAIAAAIKDAGGEAIVAPDGSFQSRPDVAIVVTGEMPYAEFHGDVPHLAFTPRHGEEALIARLRAQGTKVVVVFLSGRPMFISKLINQADAFVAAWLPGSQGQGVADVLVAGRNGRPLRGFSGRLPFDWPADARSPMAPPLFRSGYGLDYTRQVRLGRLNEDPRLVLAAYDTTTSFMRRGVVPAPWYLAADGAVSNRAIDLSAQEDARQFTWTGAGRFSIIGTPVDLAGRGAEGAVLVLDWRIDSHSGAPVKIALGGGALDIGGLVIAASPGRAIETRIPLRCFVRAGANLASVGGPLQIEASTGLTVTIRTVRIEEGKGSDTCPASD
ncbi:MAG: glycoside hydrolase family 3 N-terminal domain-containing protein [Novosphingobium sp.]|jgi:beta-glucosidase|nr:glycoside hydrolase family 3 C-terminal domain-containing protein [Novosphingobium sp.]